MVGVRNSVFAYVCGFRVDGMQSLSGAGHRHAMTRNGRGTTLCTFAQPAPRNRSLTVSDQIRCACISDSLCTLSSKSMFTVSW